MNITYTRLVVVGNRGILTADKINADENYYRELKNLLKLKHVKNFPFVRVGKANDGGYIMLDAFQKMGGGGGIAYSFGISGDVSWDYDMVKRGYEIFMYDMTIDALPFQHKNFHFFKQGIGGTKNKEKLLDTLENFFEINGHGDKENLILKMDVEGAEWDFLNSVSSDLLNRFDQIVFEFHNLISPKNSAQMEKVIAAFKKLNLTHTPIHVHGNNYGAYINIEGLGIFPDVPEITYVKTENYTFEEDENILLPISLDEPNNPFVPDIPLGYWNKF